MKIIFLDIDGTLYKAEEKSVRSEVKEALKTIRNKDVKMIVATGRSYIYIPECIKELEPDGFICSNGSFIVMKDEIIKEKFLDAEKVRNLIQYLEQNQFQYDLQTKDKVYSKKSNRKLKIYQEYSEVLDERIENEYDLEEIINKIHKINIRVDKEEIDELLKVTEAFEKEIHLGTNHIELFADCCTKGTGVKTVLQSTGIPKEEAIAFGDSMNDVSMFAEVGLSIAMGNADSRLKEVAKEITDSVENAGVATFFQNLPKRC